MEKEPFDWQDHYEYAKERQIYTDKEHGIPGLKMIGFHNTTHAISPLPPHYHSGSFEFTYLVQGNLQFAVGAKSYHLSGGDVYITEPDEVHDTGTQPMFPHQMYWFQLDIRDPSHFLFLDPDVAKTIIDRLYQLPHRVVSMKGTLLPQISSIISNAASGSELDRIQAGISLGSLLCRILKQAETTTFRITPDIGRATEYIMDHISEEISMEDLAKVTLLSVSRFKQKFKAQIGISPRNYINFQKIEAAKIMLQEGHSATDTAMELNFSNSNYFSAVFRRYTLRSPTEYITQWREKSAEKAEDSSDPDQKKQKIPKP